MRCAQWAMARPGVQVGAPRAPQVQMGAVAIPYSSTLYRQEVKGWRTSTHSGGGMCAQVAARRWATRVSDSTVTWRMSPSRDLMD